MKTAEHNLKAALKQYFGFNTFKGQQEAIMDPLFIIIRQIDVIILLAEGLIAQQDQKNDDYAFVPV